MKRTLSLLLLFWLLSFPLLHAQYQVNGSAISQGNDCFRITPNLTSQSGSVWYLNQVDISKPFDLYFDIFLGCSNGGADGMAFVLQQVSTSVGSLGGGLGYQGITPSVAIEFDTYRNGNNGDPVADHIAIQSNGNVNHGSTTNNLAGPVPVLANSGNVEDCNFHTLRITWDTTNYTLRVFFDCALRLSYTGNIIANIFNNNPRVFWGFTAATGAATNEHRFCLNYISFTQALQDTAICLGDTVQLDVGSADSVFWSPSIGLSDDSVSNPLAFPDTTTTYIAAIKDPCGQIIYDSVTVTVGDSASLLVDLGVDTIMCGNDSLLYDLSRAGVGYLWQNGDTLPTFSVKTPGTYWAEITNACGAMRDSILIDYELLPVVNLGPDTLVCNVGSLQLDATFASQTMPGTTYLWQDGSTNATFTAMTSDTFWVQVSNYCGITIDSIVVTFGNSPIPVNLGPDTILCPGDTLLLDATQPAVTYAWNPISSDSAIVARTSGTYSVTLTNGCGTSFDAINVTVLPSLILDLGPADTSLCPGALLSYNVFQTGALATYTWPGGVVNPSYAASQSGMITCVAMNMCETISDSILLSYDSLPKPDLTTNLPLCPGDSITLDLTTPNTLSYQWIGGPAQPLYTIKSPGTYIGQATNRCGTTPDTVVVFAELLPVVELGEDTLLCNDDSLTLNIFSPGYTYNWRDGSVDSIRTIHTNGLYWVEVGNACGTARDSVFVYEETSPLPIDLGPDTAICEGQQITLDVTALNVNYLWSDSSVGPTLTIQKAGTYWVETSNECGMEHGSMQLFIDVIPTPDLGPDSSLCEGEKLTFNMFHERSTYLWQDGWTNPVNVVDQSGNYWVEVTNSCGTGRDELAVIFDMPPPDPNLGLDDFVCTGDTVFLDATVASTPTAPNSYSWADGWREPNRLITESLTYFVTVRNRCGSSRDAIKLTFEEPLIVDLGPDTVRCQEEPIYLDATLPERAFYRWHNGRIEPTFTAEEAGIYAVEVTNSCGTVADTITISDTDCSCTVYLPSAFSPNDDGKNDLFHAFYDCELRSVQLKIFDRWGTLVFESDNFDDAWDGRKGGQHVPEGVYVWTAVYTGLKNKLEAKKTMSGTVTVIR